MRVQRWIPQEELLPWCRAVVSQGGSGIALGALAHGLPSVLLPVGADQPHTAARVAELGAAVVLDPVTASPDEIGAAVRRVLDERVVRATRRAACVRRSWRCRRLRRRLRGSSERQLRLGRGSEGAAAPRAQTSLGGSATPSDVT